MAGVIITLKIEQPHKRFKKNNNIENVANSQQKLEKKKKLKSNLKLKKKKKRGHEGSPAARMLPIRVRSFRAFSTSLSSIFRKTCRMKQTSKT